MSSPTKRQTLGFLKRENMHTRASSTQEQATKKLFHSIFFAFSPKAISCGFFLCGESDFVNVGCLKASKPWKAEDRLKGFEADFKAFESSEAFECFEGGLTGFEESFEAFKGLEKHFEAFGDSEGGFEGFEGPCPFGRV